MGSPRRRSARTAESGADAVSLGALTHSAPALPFHLELVPAALKPRRDLEPSEVRPCRSKRRSPVSKEERNAVLLAHNYQRPEVQDVADFVGDSLYLSRKAMEADRPVIVFAGVRFMAETAKILNPTRTVLLPDLKAGCALADSITAEQLRDWKAQHPGAVVVAYINTSADVKAEADYCCTSSNAVKVVEEIPRDREILFLPDMFLGDYVRKKTGRAMHLWVGDCPVHAKMRPEDMDRGPPGASGRADRRPPGVRLRDPGAPATSTASSRPTGWSGSPRRPARPRSWSRPRSASSTGCAGSTRRPGSSRSTRGPSVRS